VQTRCVIARLYRRNEQIFPGVIDTGDNRASGTPELMHEGRAFVSGTIGGPILKWCRYTDTEVGCRVAPSLRELIQLLLPWFVIRRRLLNVDSSIHQPNLRPSTCGFLSRTLVGLGQAPIGGPTSWELPPHSLL